MQVTSSGVRLTARDLAQFAACPHHTNVEIASIIHGQFDLPAPRDDLSRHFAGVRTARVERHLGRLVERFGEDRVLDLGYISRRDERERLTRSALDASDGDGYDVIRNPLLTMGRYDATPDFLVRGPQGWEAVDARLARTAQAGAVLQLAHHSAQVMAATGTRPEHMHVVLGDDRVATLDFGRFEPFETLTRQRLDDWLTNPQPTAADATEHCTACSIRRLSDTELRLHDEVSRLPGATGRFAELAARAGYPTIKALAGAGHDMRLPGVGEATQNRMVRLAQLRVESRGAGPRYEFIAPERPGVGLGALPEPHPHDLFFNIAVSGPDDAEGDGDLVYLWSIRRRGDGKQAQQWAFDPAEERDAFVRFVERVTLVANSHPGAHVYQYSPNGTSTLMALSEKYGVMGPEIRSLRRSGTFVDAFNIVYRGMLTSGESYALRDVAEPMGFRFSEPALTAGAGLLAFERAIAMASEGTAFKPSIARRELGTVAASKMDELRAVRFLMDSAEAGRARLIDSGIDVDRPAPRVSTRTADEQNAAVAADAELRQIQRALTKGVPAAEHERNDAEQALWTLARALDFYPREASAGWREYFERLSMTEAELFDEPEAIAGLASAGPPEKNTAPRARSSFYPLTFDASQPFSFAVGDEVMERVRNPDGSIKDRSAGTIERLEVRDGEGLLVLKRSSGREAPTSIIKRGPIDAEPQREAVLALARLVLQIGIDGNGPARAARDALLRRHPVIDGIDSGDDLPGLLTTVAAMAETIVPVQGGPGSGKTTRAAKLAVAAIKRGERVAVTASSHNAITNLVDAVCAEAERQELAIAVVQRGDTQRSSRHDFVKVATSNDAVFDALDAGGVDVVAGTPWLLSLPRFRYEEVVMPDGTVAVQNETFGLLIIDEGGKFAVPDALAVLPAARNAVVVGDHGQLPKPQVAHHDPSAGASILEYLVGDHTVPRDRGVFLKTTYRMTPTTTAFVSEDSYNGRLVAARGNSRQRVTLDHPIGGKGNRLVLVRGESHPNGAREVATAVDVVRTLLQRDAAFVDRHGHNRPLTTSDVILQSGTNAEVGLIREALARALPNTAADAIVDTVDGNQGRQAPVQIFTISYSGGGAGGRTLPRHLTRARVNTGVSRAQALTFVVAHIDVFRHRCNTPEEMAVLGTLHRFADRATVLDADLGPTTVVEQLRFSHPVPRYESLIKTPLAVPSQPDGRSIATQGTGLALEGLS